MLEEWDSKVMIPRSLKSIHTIIKLVECGEVDMACRLASLWLSIYGSGQLLDINCLKITDCISVCVPDNGRNQSCLTHCDQAYSLLATVKLLEEKENY